MRFFVPIIYFVVCSKEGQPRKTRAIIVYPINALANSQIKEIEKFISQSGLREDLKPVVRRYTGQESQEERQRIADNSPDILLTNFVMTELLLTRQDDLDNKVIDNANGLEFIVLDELHTYRCRQGADVAILVRRLRNRCAPAKAPICIGTSATMASEGSDTSRAKAVTDVATSLFGATIGPDAVIDESLQQATDDRLRIEDVKPKLAEALTAALPEILTDAELKPHPLAVWAARSSLGAIPSNRTRASVLPSPASRPVASIRACLYQPSSALSVIRSSNRAQNHYRGHSATSAAGEDTAA